MGIIDILNKYAEENGKDYRFRKVTPRLVDSDERSESNICPGESHCIIEGNFEDCEGWGRCYGTYDADIELEER